MKQFEIPIEQYSITTMTPEHYDDAYQLWQTHEGIGLGRADSRERIAGFLERNRGLSFVATLNDRIIGTVLGGHDGRRGFVYHLIVDSNYRSRGIGRALVGSCLEGFRRIGIEKSHVFVFKINESGVGFWSNIGYRLRDDLFIMSFDIQ